MNEKVQTDPQEKRAIRRFTLQLPVAVTSQAGLPVAAAAESRDVSSQGICFLADMPLEPRSRIEFTLTLPAEVTMTDPIQVRCVGSVVRASPLAAEGRFSVAAVIESYEFVAAQESQNILCGADRQAGL